MVRCGSKNTLKKDVCLEEIGLHVQILLHCSRLNGQHNSEDFYDLSIPIRVVTLKMKKIYSYINIFGDDGYHQKEPCSRHQLQTNRLSTYSLRPKVIVMFESAFLSRLKKNFLMAKFI